MSARRRAEIPERTAVVLAALERDRYRCQAPPLVPEIRCAGPLDPHEIIPRSAWHAGYLRLDNVMILCRAHHDWVGDHPDLAHRAGLHGFSWERTR
jgi:hypothetical protein